MTTKQTSVRARANLFVTREKMASAHGSAQSRAFRARQLAKDARDAAARRLDAAKKAGASAVAPGAGDGAGEPPQQDEPGTTSDG